MGATNFHSSPASLTSRFVRAEKIAGLPEMFLTQIKRLLNRNVRSTRLIAKTR